jgi:methanol--5-hydroxybenzimidazolylcobamide Co-methyltransferase
MEFKELTIKNPDDLFFGTAPNPVKTPRGLIIGGGMVYPELNFTLPMMSIDKNDHSKVIKQYREIVTGALEHALHLHTDGFVLEFETLIEMTQVPEMGIEIVKAMNEVCEQNFKTRFEK